MKCCTIYSLSSSRNNQPRYIGQTTQLLKTRLCQHRNYAKRRQTAVHKWMFREQQEGFVISITSVCEQARFNLDEIEIIGLLRMEGVKLLNHTEGGEGTVGWRGNRGRKRPDLAARNRSNTGKPGHPMSDENKKKLIASIKGSKRPWLAQRNRESKVWLGRKHTEETKAKQSAALKAFHEARQKI
ncbi:MAG TPA: NUMOD3 domain-containing DNA-binding protein [Candidatus Acidoferrales bacterium]|nr:NUMOD3 domain-containing DNA-binding protein [Candidatus Acidoferrales bacterium]